MRLGPNSVRLQLTLTARVQQRLERLAVDAGMTKSQYLTMLINEKWGEEANHTDGDDGFLCV
uniref:Ribbon-helix-helix protein CopG domain-containing protein n=1 Tax=uncultured prokaryote TaxID=198431 RepID=A0A0H5Q4X6_9ZZZZ|nr:hypothetical protein [uncultured prokaryote]